jgi:hypothetical protein
MQIGLIYRSQFLNIDSNVTVTIDIKDSEVLIDDSDTPTIINLIPSGNPFTLSTVNNDRKKFGIFSKQATIEFHSTSSVNAWTFADSKDNRYLVDAYTDNYTIFLGFLVVDEMARPFLPNPNIISLVASDNLGLLKEKKLTTPAVNNPTGKNRYADYISWCLTKTGLSLPIKVANNIRPGAGMTTVDVVNFSSASSFILFPITRYTQFYPGMKFTTNSPLNNGTVFTVTENNNGFNIGVTPVPVHEGPVFNIVFTDQVQGHIYDVCYLDAKTFEAEIGESQDCYSVLEKIFDKDCFITQYKGEWWIMRPDDFDDSDVFLASFDPDGTYDSTAGAATFNKNVGENENQYWVDVSQGVEYERPYKFGKHTFRYEYPKEIPCNINFERGDFISDVSATEKKYNLDCWTLKEGVPAFPGTVDGTTATIHRLFNINSYELERYIVLTPRTTFEGSSLNDATYIESEPIPIQIKDKFSCSVKFRLDQNISTGGNGSARLFRCILKGNDGSYWILGEASTGDGKAIWYNTLNWVANSAKGATSVDFDVDDTEWRTISWDAPQAPVTGDLYLWMNQFNQLNSSDDNREIWYSDLSFSYIPFINATYAKFIGQSSKSERIDEGYSANTDEDVSISDSPKPILMGGIFVNRGIAFDLMPTFFNATPFGNLTPSDSSKFLPYEKIRVQAVYNQNRKGIRYFTGTVRWNIEDWPDLIHKYFITDIDPDSNNRRFMCLSLEQNWKLFTSTVKFSQTFHTDGKDYDDPFEFKYITE